MNQAIEWIKSHPTESLLAAGAIGGLVWLMTRSSGGSSAGNAASSYYGAQLQMAALNTQAATQQAQVQAQQNVAAYAAQVENNKTAAELAAVAQQYQAGVETAKIAADVQNLQTTTQGSVATTYINAASEVTKSQLAAEQNGLQYEYQYLTSANNNQTQLSKQVLDTVAAAGLNHGTQSLENTLAQITESALGNPGGAVQATAYQGAVVGAANAANDPLSILAAQAGKLTSAFTSLFG